MFNTSVLLQEIHFQRGRFLCFLRALCALVVEFLKHRPIRSYVRREGRLTAGQRRALEVSWPLYGLEFDGQPVDFDAVFNRTAPKVLEIGFGNGESLVTQARENRDIDFVGIEVHRPGVGHLLQLLERDELSNVRIGCRDAVEVLSTSVPDDTFRQISIFFPDPWPKKRHHKRRLLQTQLVELLGSKLQRNGTLHVATDWADYAHFVRETMAATDRFEKADTRRALPRPETRFEQRGRGKGHEVFDLVYSVIK